jgi:hypothetical protein
MSPPLSMPMPPDGSVPIVQVVIPEHPRVPFAHFWKMLLLCITVGVGIGTAVGTYVAVAVIRAETLNAIGRGISDAQNNREAGGFNWNSLPPVDDVPSSSSRENARIKAERSRQQP